MSRYDRLRHQARRLVNSEVPQANIRRVTKNTLLLYVRMLVVMVVGLFTSRVQLKALGVEDFGLYQVATATVAMFIFLNGSLSGATSRFLTVEIGRGKKGSLKRMFSTLLTVHGVLAIIFAVLLETVGIFVLKNNLNIEPDRIGAVMWAFQCAVATMFLSVTQVPYSAVLIAHERMSAFAYMSLYDVTAKLAVAYLLFVSNGDRLKLYATLLALVSVTSLLFYRFYCRMNFSEARWRKVFDFKLLKPVFSFAGWQIAAQTVTMLLTQGVLMVNQRYFGPALVAAIAIAQAVNGAVQSFISNFRMAANPQIIKLYAAQKFEESKRLFIESTRFSVFLLMVLGVPIWFYSNEVLMIWLGDNVPKYTAQILRIVLIGAFFSIFDVSFYIILYAAGRIKENAYFNWALGTVTFLSIIALIHFFRNPLVSVIVLTFQIILIGLFVKPFLAHIVAKYRWQDFKQIYVPSLLATLLCVLVTGGVRSIFPISVLWVLFAVVFSAVLNLCVVFIFVTSREMQGKAVAFANRIPIIGKLVSQCGRCVMRMTPSALDGWFCRN